MKVKELIKTLKTFDQEADILVASDEELNIVFKGFEVMLYGDTDEENNVVIFGLSGQELDY